MAKYYNMKEKIRYIDLISFADEWRILKAEDIDGQNNEDRTFEEMLNENYVALDYTSKACTKTLSDTIDNVNPLYPDLGFIELHYLFEHGSPKADYICYPAYSPSGSDDIPDERYDSMLYLNKKEKVYFTSLLRNTIELKKCKKDSGLFLLSIEEVGKIPKETLAYKDGWWWLRSPGNDAGCAACVYFSGRMSRYGDDVGYGFGCVRPALYLNPTDLTSLERTKKGYIKLGSTPNGKPVKWIDISLYMGRPCLLMKKPIEKYRFDAESNDYEKSDIKARLAELDEILFSDEERKYIL